MRKDTLAANVGTQRMALTEAGTALGELDLDDLSDQTKIDEAQAAVDALKMALEGATHLSDDEKAMYQTRLDEATETVRVAETGMELNDRIGAQRTAIMNAATMASTAVAGVSDTSTDSEVAAADAAVKDVKDAIAAAEALSEDDDEIIKARAVLRVIEPLLANAKTSRTAYLEKKGDDDAKTMAATGKDLHAALAGNATDGTTALDNATVTWPEEEGLTITPAAGAGANADDVLLDPVTFAATDGSSAGALGSWNGMDFADSEGTGDDLVTTEARVYTNQGAPTTTPFVLSGDNKGKYPLSGGTLAVADTDEARALVMAAAFTHSATQNHAIPEGSTWFAVRGTYDGAPGEFRCTTGPCSSSNDGKGSPSGLGGTWVFKPDTGAMVSQPDANYLYYGWWVSKDSKGMPTAASAFSGVVGETPTTGTGTAILLSDGVALTGSATYAGHAAGKFAINNVLDGTGDGGHFTADAMLTATFGPVDAPNNGGVTGTIDNFRLNDGSEDPGWSVKLNRAQWGATGMFTDAATTANADDNVADGTTWSINGNAAPESGVWSGQVYDELPGDTDDDPAGDGSTIPTTVTGTFYSEFSAIGRMVGAFGADKQ